MSDPYPPNWARVQSPWVRRELLLTLEELSLSDPRSQWRKEAAEGLCPGIDEIIHFLFDDHDFGVGAIGVSLFDAAEVQALAELKLALNALINKYPKGGDADYVADPMWLVVSGAARAASAQMQAV